MFRPAEPAPPASPTTAQSARAAPGWPPHPTSPARPVAFRPTALPGLEALEVHHLDAACRYLARAEILANPHREPQVAVARRHGARDAAVLIGWEVEPGYLPTEPTAPLTHLLLIERAAGTRFAGHIAFPGGHRDETDAHPIATATRESREEIGLAADALCVRGVLPAYYSHAGHRIVAVVASVAAEPTYRLDPAEARRLIRLPVAVALGPGGYTLRTRSRRPYRANYQCQFVESSGPVLVGGPTLSLLIHLHAALAAVAGASVAQPHE